MAGLLGQKFRQNDIEKLWRSIFDRIKSEALIDERKRPTLLAKLPKNFQLNRYINVLPYDDSIVKLKGDIYINASHVNNEEVGRYFILAQGPLVQTTDHFWQMVWEYNTRCIVMLTRIIEQNQVKCHKYFPGTELNQSDTQCQTSLTCGNGIQIDLQEENHKKHFSKRTFVLKNNKEAYSNEREIVQFQFNTWPDFGVPEKTDDFLEFLTEVRKQDCFNCKSSPVVCHCSAGIGRSGTFVLADTALALVQKTKDPSKVDIKQMILNYRRSRMGLIQTHEQLRFAWKSVVDALDQPDRWKHLFTSEEDDDAVSRVNSLKRPTASPVLTPIEDRLMTSSLVTSSSSAEEEQSSAESPKRAKATPNINGCLLVPASSAVVTEPPCADVSPTSESPMISADISSDQQSTDKKALSPLSDNTADMPTPSSSTHADEHR